MLARVLRRSRPTLSAKQFDGVALLLRIWPRDERFTEWVTIYENLGETWLHPHVSESECLQLIAVVIERAPESKIVGVFHSGRLLPESDLCALALKARRHRAGGIQTQGARKPIRVPDVARVLREQELLARS